MTVVLGDKKIQDIGSWQQYYVPNLYRKDKKSEKAYYGEATGVMP